MEPRTQILTPGGPDAVREQIARDSVLPPDICPRPRTPGGRRRVLVTGASGFLGRYLVATLLRDTDWDVVCLVRAGDEAAARARLDAALAATGRALDGAGARLHVVCGDVARPRLGLAPARFERLAAEVDTVFHGAAEVNWVKPYAALRAANVLGTRHAIELACHGHAKPLYFVSTLAVCYAHDGPAQVSETTDMAAHVDDMPLAYAQTKYVSEVLLRQAGARGLPVTIVRPSLICGDSATGASNEDDLVSRLIKGCVTIGAAADVDWQLDVCPVDHVADVLVALAADPGAGAPVLHLHHPNPRHWRELVLWLNLFGYRLPFLGFEDWLARLAATPRAQCRELFALRPFFLGRPARLAGRRLPELYLEPVRRRIRSERSHGLLAARGLTPPAIDAALLGRYFDRYLDSGFLPAVPEPMLRVQPAFDVGDDFLESLLRRAHGDAGLRIVARSVTRAGAHSIVNELSSARGGREVGIWRHRVRYRRAAAAADEETELLVKIKADDHTVARIARAIGELHGGALAAVAHQLPRALGIRGAHARELAICAAPDARLARHMPKVYGAHADAAAGVWLLVMEYLAGAEMLDSLDTGAAWSAEHIDAAIAGLAAIHSVWYRREPELRAQPWLAPAPGADDGARLRPLWQALADAAAAPFAAACGVGVGALRQRLLDTLPDWWPELDAQPATLIHNDFNPRNLAFRRTPQGPELCAYDWELATLGPPQHDLAELLCFVLPQDAGADTVRDYLDRHRRLLQAAHGADIAAPAWEAGFRLALRHLAVNRLPLYTLIDRFKPQPFLPATLRNWYRLYRWFDGA